MVAVQRPAAPALQEERAPRSPLVDQRLCVSRWLSGGFGFCQPGRSPPSAAEILPEADLAALCVSGRKRKFATTPEAVLAADRQRRG